MFDEKIVFDESLFQNKFFVKHFRVWSNNFSCLHRFPLFHQTGEEKTVNRITIWTFYIIIRKFLFQKLNKKLDLSLNMADTGDNPSSDEELSNNWGICIAHAKHFFKSHQILQDKFPDYCFEETIFFSSFYPTSCWASSWLFVIRISKFW